MFGWQQERQQQMILIGSSTNEGRTEEERSEISFCDLTHLSL